MQRVGGCEDGSVRVCRVGVWEIVCEGMSVGGCECLWGRV